MKLFVENLTHIDFSYIHAERGLLGESWAVNLVLEGGLDEQGMICDFGMVKKLTKQWLDTWVDHRLLVAEGLPRLQWQLSDGVVEVRWPYPEGEELYCQAPQQAIGLVEAAQIDPTTLAHWCEAQLLKLFPGQVEGVRLEFVPEAIDGAFYHYSHGLEQHEGNCQRIAHGHRSRIVILRDGERDQALEHEWAQRLHDIYIGTRSHLAAAADGRHIYRYEAPQGRFELALPNRNCYLIDAESTVEQIAQHLLNEIKLRYPDAAIEVRAFEGIGKGAIAAA